MSLLFLSHCIRRLLRSRSAVVSLVCVSILCAVAGAYTTYRNTEYGQVNKEVIDILFTHPPSVEVSQSVEEL